MAPRTVALIGAASLSAGWLVASLLTPPVARLQSLPERRRDAAPQTRDVTVSPPPLVQWRALPAGDPPTTRRNPFLFARRDPSSPIGESPSAIAESPAESPVPPIPAALNAPPYTLSGIAVTGDLRTAVLSDGSTVHLVTAGQTIGAFTVHDVSEESVTLTDAAGKPFVIRLR